MFWRFCEKKVCHKTFKTFFLGYWKLTVGNMPTGGAAATAAAFRPFRGLRHSMARRFSDGEPFILEEKEIDQKPFGFDVVNCLKKGRSRLFFIGRQLGSIKRQLFCGAIEDSPRKCAFAHFQPSERLSAEKGWRKKKVLQVLWEKSVSQNFQNSFFRGYWKLTVGNMPTRGAAATAAASLLSVACATRWQDASEWGIVVEKRKL